jgi:hypothetical protein
VSWIVRNGADELEQEGRRKEGQVKTKVIVGSRWPNTRGAMICRTPRCRIAVGGVVSAAASWNGPERLPALGGRHVEGGVREWQVVAGSAAYVTALKGASY